MIWGTGDSHCDCHRAQHRPTPALNCASKGVVALRNGRTLVLKFRYQPTEYTHDTGVAHFRGTLCGHRAKISFFMGVSMVTDENGQPKALGSLACRPPALADSITRLKGTLLVPSG
jgi:hypothetical protein